MCELEDVKRKYGTYTRHLPRRRNIMIEGQNVERAAQDIKLSGVRNIFRDR